MRRADIIPVMLLTGIPGSGKSTLISRLAAKLGVRAGGFMTAETRDSNGRRTGFEIVALTGERLCLASIEAARKSDDWLSFGRYWVNMDAVERVAVPSVIAAMEQSRVVVIDEIGPMELLSSFFCDVVWRLVDSNSIVIGTIVERSHPMADLVKQHSRVQLYAVTPATRDGLDYQILEALSPWI